MTDIGPDSCAEKQLGCRSRVIRSKHHPHFDESNRYTREIGRVSGLSELMNTIDDRLAS